MRRITFLAIALLAVLAVLLNSSGERAIADEGPSIGVCCAWNGKLSDGELTYKISGGDAAAQSIVRGAVEEWETKVEGLTLTEVSGRDKADINIKFKKGGGQIQGQALRKFDRQGFINSVDLNISGSAFGSPNNADIVGQITKHEFGHALGIDHANFDGDLMSPTVSGGSTAISDCDVKAVVAANHWKLVDEASPPHAPHVDHVHCP